MKPSTLTHHEMRCPMDERPACLTVRSGLDSPPSRRHREVLTCSLAPSPPFVPGARPRYFSDLPAPMGYLEEIETAPRHAARVSCPAPCLAVLNAAEPGATEPPGCASGACDGLELARLTQGPSIMRLLWLHGA